MLGNLQSESPSACYNGDGWCWEGVRRGEMLKNAVSLVPLRILFLSLSLSVFVGVSRSSWLLADASPPPALQPCSTAQHRSGSRDKTDTEGWVNVMSVWLVTLVMLYCVCFLLCVCEGLCDKDGNLKQCNDSCVSPRISLDLRFSIKILIKKMIYIYHFLFIQVF